MAGPVVAGGERRGRRFIAAVACLRRPIAARSALVEHEGEAVVRRPAAQLIWNSAAIRSCSGLALIATSVEGRTADSLLRARGLPLTRPRAGVVTTLVPAHSGNE